MSFEVGFSVEAEDDLMRLFDYLIDRAKTLEDSMLAEAAIEAIRSAALHQLAITPFSFRKTGRSTMRRELVIPFGATGYVASYEITSSSSVVILAVRHQREEDYH